MLLQHFISTSAACVMRLVAKIVVGTLAVAPWAVFAAAPGPVDKYPEQTIRLVVPWGHGSATDSLARVLASGLAESLGTPVIVDNRAGADGNIGAAYVAKAPPDGYTIMLGTASTNAVNYSLQKGLSYDPRRDFQAVARIASIPNVLVVGKKMSVSSVKDLIQNAKDKRYHFASTGAGGTLHLSGELFKARTGLDLLHIPYKGGSALLPDLITGRVEMMFCNLPLCLPQIESGNLVALAVTSAQRADALPDVPTLAESGVKDFDISGWYGIFAPAGTPRPIVDRLNKAIVEVLHTSRVSESYKAQGAKFGSDTPDQFQAFTKAEFDRWAQFIKDYNISK